jgi:hypothetical protein
VKGGIEIEMGKKTKKQTNFPGLKDLDVASRAELEKELESRYPGGFSLRDEANAIAARAYRNGPIEDLHVGEHSELLENKNLSRITDDEMKEIMIYAAKQIAVLLKKKDEDPEEYYTVLKGYGFFYCSGWDRD